MRRTREKSSGKRKRRTTNAREKANEVKGETENEGKGKRGGEPSSSREWNMKIFGIWTEFAAFPQPRRLCSSYEQKTPAKLCSPR